MQRLWQRMALNRFLVLGRVGMDLHADPPGQQIDTATRYMAAIGGSAGNIAVALARQGASASLVSCLSDDPVGRFCLNELAGYGVGTDHIRIAAGQTRTSLALTETVADGCQTVIYRNGAADLSLQASDVSAPDYGSAAALVVTGTALAVEPSRSAAFAAMGHARAAGALVVLDIDYRPYSWSSMAEAAQVCGQAAQGSDIVVGNDVEFGLIAGDMALGCDHAAGLVRQGALLAIYKRGPDGCSTFTPDYSFDTPIFRVSALKPTGAGDGFMGGFLSGLARGLPVDQAVRRGAAMAAMVVSAIGCAPAMPTRAALDDFLARAS